MDSEQEEEGSFLAIYNEGDCVVVKKVSTTSTFDTMTRTFVEINLKDYSYNDKDEPSITNIIYPPHRN